MNNNITHYYFEKGHCNTLQSKVHKAVRDFLALHHGKLISITELPVVKSFIQKGVEEINGKFPRCKPVKLGFETWSVSKNILVTGIEGMSFTFKASTLSHASSFVNPIQS